MARKTEEQTEQATYHRWSPKFLKALGFRDFGEKYHAEFGPGLFVLNASATKSAHTDRSVQTTSLTAKSFNSDKQYGVAQVGTSIDFDIDRGHWISDSSTTMITQTKSWYEAFSSDQTGEPDLLGAYYKFEWPNQRTDEILKPRINLEVGEDYIAEYDGFLTGHLSGMAPTKGIGYLIYQEYINGIAEDVAGASVNVNLAKDVNIFEGTFTVPVKRGTRYRVDFCISERPAHHAFEAQLTFIPVNPEVFKFGDITTPTTDTLITPHTDGLLLASASVQSAGDRGWQKIYTGVPTMTKHMVLESGLRGSASVHVWPSEDAYIPYGSALVPVPHDFPYCIEDGTTSGNPKFTYRWIPMLDPD